MLSSLKKFLLIGLGWLCVFLGVIGIFLPLLPTTPFMLLALWCFARSSRRFHQALLNNKHIGPSLRQWQEHRVIERRIKLRAYVFIVISFSVSVYFVKFWLLKAMLLIMMCALIYFMHQVREELPPPRDF
ncbi:MAG: YbaN family protein [Pseudomonadales bacterium]